MLSALRFLIILFALRSVCRSENNNISLIQESVRLLWISPRSKSNITNKMQRDLIIFEQNAGALSLAVREYEQRYNPSYRVQLLFAPADSDNAVQALEQLMLFRDGFDVLIGPPSSPAAIPASFLLQTLHRPHISWVAGSNELTDRKLHPNVVRPFPTPALTAQCMTQAAGLLDWSRIAFVKWNDPDVRYCDYI